MLEYEDDDDFDDLYDDEVELDEGTCDVELLDDEDKLLIDDICAIADIHDKDELELTKHKSSRITQKAICNLTEFKLDFYFLDNEPANMHERYQIREVQMNLHKRDRIHQVRPLSAKRLL